MLEIRVAIHQPNFFPWIGYFYKIAKSDVFIFLDDVQFPRGNRGCVVNRSMVLAGDKQCWLTLPVKKHSGSDKILDMRLAENGLDSVLKKIHLYYGGFPHFQDVMGELEKSFATSSDKIVEININIIKNICENLGIYKKYVKSSELNVSGHKQEKIINLVKKLKGTIYISGEGAKKYQDEESFLRNNIVLIYQNPIKNFSGINLEEKENDLSLSILHYLFLFGFEKLQDFLSSGSER